MVEARRVTIGGTINLENFENFRYEFEGVVTTVDDYVSLAGFAAGCLLNQATNADTVVRERIRTHIVRTFGIREEDLPGAPAGDVTKPAATPEVQDAAPQPPSAAEQAKAAVAQCVKPPSAAGGTPRTANKTVVGTCEKCGARITELQAKVSQLFMNKSLCKACMEVP